ncbi:MAG: hypothetical protein Q7S40_33705 [Opitutaceae bacterium]|nr:hypothetical protein [Opitutaceae bacterium]
MGLVQKLTPRIVFWILFLCLAVFAFGQIWLRLDPLRNHPAISQWWLQHNVAQLGSTDRAVAVNAWREIERCYLTKWSAYDWVVWRVKQNVWAKTDPPIHFRLKLGGNRYYAMVDPGQSDCRTVNESLMAILYQEPGWQTPFQGDWRKWWEANWNYFPNRELKALPSGPEAPRRRK